MKKIILFSAVAFSVAFFACKKDSKTDTTTPTDESTSIDPVALSAAVKIGSATNVTGDLPAASADGPTLYIDGYENRTYYALNNRYVVIYPQSDKGFVAGYYVKINGANTYFKIDYKAAAGVRKLNTFHGFREEGDNSDSSILIKLPAGLTGDTFSVKYAAYDTLNRVSNTITAIVSIIAPKDSTNNRLLYGTWRFNRQKKNHNDWSEPEAYNKMDTSYYSYSCVDGKLQYCQSDCQQYPYRIYGWISNDLIFSANNTYTTVYNFMDKRIRENVSTCSDLQYESGYGRDGSYVSGFTYNATTKVLTIISDGNGTDNDEDASSLYTTQYFVSEISATKLVYYERTEYNEDRIGARDNDVNISYYEYLKQ